MTLPEQLGRELCSLLEEAGLAGQTDFAGALDQPGTLVFLGPQETGFQLFLLDNAVCLSYLGENPPRDFLYLLCPEPAPET